MDNEAAGRASVRFTTTASETPAPSASRVAAVTVSFWILKTLLTTLGDLSGDALSIALHLGYALALGVTLAVTASLLLAQVKAQRFQPTLYWALMLSTSAAGAEISDAIDRALHLGNAAGAGLLLATLAVTLAAWRVRCGAIRYRVVRDRQEELFYWAAALLANSLGSALGDLFGDKLGLGVLGATGVNCAIVAVLLALRYTTRRAQPVLFWGAFVFTRIPF